MLHETIVLPSAGGSTTLRTYCPAVMGCDTSPEGRISVLICPGGGYDHLSERESEPIALAFAAMGMNAFVAEYRVAPERYPSQLYDAAVSVRHIRSNAAKYHSNPGRIAVMGFSAGGHLAASLGAKWQDEAFWAPLNLKPAEIKPDALVLCYPVIDAGEYGHTGSFRALTGSDDPSVHAGHSVSGNVTASFPPSFIWHTREDASVPVKNSIALADALCRAGVHFELHVFPKGPHGLALANSITSLGMPERILSDASRWPEMAAAFLRQLPG